MRTKKRSAGNTGTSTSPPPAPPRGKKTPDKKPRRLTGTTPDQAKAIQRRDELRALLERDGYAGLKVYAFAAKHGVHHSTVYNDLKQIGRDVGEERGETLVASILARLSKAEEVFLDVADGDDQKARVHAGKALVEMSRLEVELLDALGIRKSRLPGSESNPLRIVLTDEAGSAPEDS